jgi:hypothetical protein
MTKRACVPWAAIVFCDRRIGVRNHLLICGSLAVGKAALLGASGSGLAQAPTLDLKPGLWEITSTGAMTGAPPIPPEVLANMPPERRAQAEAMMQGAMARASEPQVMRNCVTEEQLRRGLNLDETHNPSCQRTVVSNSTRQLVVHEECAGAHPMVGDFRFAAVDRETMKGNINVVMGNGANTTTMKRSLQGKWLGSDCGDVKPKG